MQIYIRVRVPPACTSLSREVLKDLSEEGMVIWNKISPDKKTPGMTRKVLKVVT